MLTKIKTIIWFSGNGNYGNTFKMLKSITIDFTHQIYKHSMIKIVFTLVPFTIAGTAKFPVVEAFQVLVRSDLLAVLQDLGHLMVLPVTLAVVASLRRNSLDQEGQT